MDPSGRDDEGRVGEAVNLRKVGTFLTLAFGISWASALALYIAGIQIRTLSGVILVTVFFMWAPAVAAIIVQFREGVPIRHGCGLRLGRPRWAAVGWLAPVALIAATIGVGTLLPGVHFTTDYGAYLIELGLSEEQATDTVAQLEALPVPPAVLFAAQGVIAGLTINALAALGEELGWRGLLLAELSPLGFWKLSGITGAVWGIWHTPVILQGHNFPDEPLAGILMMTVATVAISPVYTYVTVRARSVLAAAFFHGSFNGLGALSLIYLTGAGNLLVSPVGVAGIGAAILAVTVCVGHDRLIADERITTGRPMTPFP